MGNRGGRRGPSRQAGGQQGHQPANTQGNQHGGQNGHQHAGQQGGPPAAPSNGQPAAQAGPSAGPIPSHTQSRSWISQPAAMASRREKLAKEIARLDRAASNMKKNMSTFQKRRESFCSRSTILERDFNIEEHNTLFNADRAQIARNMAARRARMAHERSSQGLHHSPAPIVDPPFHNLIPSLPDNRSTVLSLPTIFTPNYALARTSPLAPWPDLNEQRYEGDERIATELIHGRFLPHPRVGGNYTVNWQHRSMIPQYQLENFHYPIPDENEIFLRNSWIPALEFTDEEGEEALGGDLMGLLEED